MILNHIFRHLYNQTRIKVQRKKKMKVATSMTMKVMSLMKIVIKDLILAKMKRRISLMTKVVSMSEMIQF